MSKKPYIERLFDKELEFYLKSVGAIQIVGPKWCGKSRTAERYAHLDKRYLNGREGNLIQISAD